MNIYGHGFWKSQLTMKEGMNSTPFVQHSIQDLIIVNSTCILFYEQNVVVLMEFGPFCM